MCDHESNHACRREYYRLRYPIRNRPVLHLSGIKFDVTEISERGFRFCCHDAAVFQRGCQLVGMLVLATHTVEVRGSMARREGQEVVVVEVEGISFKCVLDEQRRVAGHFLAPPNSD